MTKKKIVSVVLAAIAAICLGVGIFLACGGAVSVFAQDEFTSDKLTLTRLKENDDKLIGAYQDAYGVPLTAIKNYTTDGGSAEGAPLSNLFDRNLATVWRASQNITETKTVSVTVFFHVPYELEGFLFQAESGGRGYFSKLKVSYHDETQVDNDEFQVFGEISSDAAGGPVYVKFNEKTKMTAVKIEWCAASKYNGNQSASSGEIVFLQPKNDKVQKVLDLYSDYAYLELKDSSTEEAIDALRAELEKESETIAAWESFIEPMLNRATQLRKNTLSFDPRREMSTADDATNQLWRHGDITTYARNTIKSATFGTNRQATGISARPGEKLVIYVQAEETDPLPTLQFTQHWGSWNFWISGSYALHRGRNIITAPMLNAGSNVDNLGEPVPAGGPVYLINPYLPAEETKPEGRTEKTQSNQVKVYFEGCTAIPTFREGGDVDAYRSDLADYAALVEQDRIENSDTRRYSMVDVTEIVSDRVTLTVQATYGNTYYNDLGYNPQTACENWDEYIKKLLMFDGIVYKEETEDVESEAFKEKLKIVNAPKYDPRNEWLNVNVRIMQPWGAAYAGVEHVGIQADWVGGGLVAGGWGWGYSHELGHMMDIPERLVGECSNNMMSKFNETVLEKTATRGDFAQNVLMLSPDAHMDSYFNTNRLNFSIWWLIESFFPGYWTKLENLYRYYGLYSIVKEERSNETINATEKQIFLSSIVTGIDMSYYFERWGYNLSVGDPVFKYEDSSELFQLMMQKGKAQGLFDDDYKPKLWYLDAAEWWVRFTGKSYEETPYFKDDYHLGELYTDKDVAPKILNITKTGSGYSLMIGDSEKYSSPNHLGYEVQVKYSNEGEDAWRVAGFATGRLFTDTATYPDGSTPVYRLVAYDRALQCSQPGDAKETGEAITEVCKLVHNGNGGTMYNSVAEAVAAAEDGDTIVVLKNTYESGIKINKKLTITVEGKNADGTSVTITKSGSEPIFTVVEEKETIATETGTEGEYTYSEVQRNGDLTLKGTESYKLVLDGFGIESEGSLVHVKSGKLTVEYCVLQNAKFKNSNSSAGGALRFEGGTLSVKNAEFKNNYARLGGAVNVTHRDGSKIEFEDCVFDGNSAVEGGALYNTSTVTLRNCEFKNNTATSVGGGIGNLSGGVMYVHDCTFTGNSTDGRGGGFYTDGKIELYGGTFTENKAETEGAAFAYNRTTSASRYFSAKKSQSENGTLPSITNNTCENGSAVMLHGEVEYFEADIQSNNVKYALRLGGATVKLNGGTIDGDLFREGSGKVVLMSTELFKKEKITVYTDAEDAKLLLFSEMSGSPALSQDYANKFEGETPKASSYDESRKEVYVELVSYTVTFQIKVADGEMQTELKHYRPGHEFTFDAFKGNQSQQWYVIKWLDGENNEYEVGKKYTVNGDVTFTAVIGTKYKIEFVVPEGDYGVQSQTFYAMPGDKYSLPKYTFDEYILNGWQLTETGTDGKAVTKMYQPAASFRASKDRTYTAVIVKKFTVRFWVEAEGEETLNYATKTYGYGSKIVSEVYYDEPYVPYGGFIDGFYIKYANGTRSEKFIDFDTYTITSDLDLIAHVVGETSMVWYTVYEDNGKNSAFLDSRYDYVPVDSEYTVSLLSIPTGYHLVKLVMNDTTLEESELQGYSFTADGSFYIIVAYVEKDVYTVNYMCNDVLFRTDTMPYGSTLTFSDPSNSLLKEALRKFPEAKSSHFTNYQLVSRNPNAGQEGEPEYINLNVMLDNQITVTSDLTINIVAYIEGYEYKADDSAGDLVEKWRTEFGRQISSFAQEKRAEIGLSTFILTDAERTKYNGEITDLETAAKADIATDVSYESMQKKVNQCLEAIEKVYEEAKLQAEKNSYIREIEAAMQDALKAFEGIEGEDAENAKAKIEGIAESAKSSVQSADAPDQFPGIVENAKTQMQEAVVEYKGDQLALRRNNAITKISSRAEKAKRDIDALPYLSAQLKTEFAELIDGDMQTYIARVNAVTTLPAENARKGSLRIESAESFSDIETEFGQRMDGIVNLEAVPLNDVKAAQAKTLSEHAATVSAEIEALLERSIADIKADGIIVINDELIASLTTFANDRLADLSALLEEKLQEIADLYEDVEVDTDAADSSFDTAKARVEAAAKQIADAAISEIDAIQTAVETDFTEKIEAAETTSRAEVVSLQIDALYGEVKARLESLGLWETYQENLDEARTEAVGAIEAAETAAQMSEAAESFQAAVEVIRLGSEKEAALKEADEGAEDLKAQITALDFLAESWTATYLGQIDNAVATLKDQAEHASYSADVRTAHESFLSTAAGIMTDAQDKNAAAANTEKAEKLAAADAKAKESLAAVNALGFLTEEEKTEYKSQISSSAEEAKTELSEVSTKAALLAAAQNHEQKLDGIVANATEASAHTEETLKAEATTKAQEAVEAFKQQLGTLTHLKEEDRKTYTDQIEAHLQTALASIQAAAGFDTLTAEQASLAQAIDTAFAAAAERDNAIAGNELSAAIVDAIKEVGEALSPLRAETEALAFLGADEKKSYSDRYTAFLSAATTIIRAAESIEEVKAKQTQQIAEAKEIAAEAQEKDRAAKEAAVSAAQEELNGELESAKTEIGSLEHLNGARETYLSALDAILSEAKSAVEEAAAPAAITEAVNGAKAQIAEQCTAARAEDALRKAKGEAKAVLDAQDSAAKSAVAEIQTLGFLEETAKSASLAAVHTAESDARAAIEAAQTADEVEQALSTYAAAVESTRSDALLKDGESATRQKAEKKDEVTKAEKELSGKIAACNYLTQERKAWLNLQITTHVQTANEAITAATCTADLEAALEAFTKNLATLEAEIKQEEDESGKAKAAEALSSAERAGTSASDALSAYGFLTEQELNEYSSRIQSAVDTAKKAIESAKSVGEIDGALETLNETLAGVKSEAESQNAANTEAKKSAGYRDFESRTTEEKGKLSAHGSLTEEEKTSFEKEIESAFARGKTGILDAQNEEMIQSALDTLDATLKDIHARAELTSAKHAAEKQVDEKAKEACESVEALGSLTNKDIYLQKIECAAESAKQEISNAETKEAAKQEADKFAAQAESVLQGAEAENANTELAAAKQTARETIKTALSSAQENLIGIENVGFLSEEEKTGYADRLSAAAEKTELSVSEANEVGGVTSLVESLEAELEEIVGEAATRAEGNETALKEAAKSKLAGRELEARVVTWSFLKGEEHAEYAEAVQAAFDAAKGAIGAAKSAEELESALSGFETAVETAQSKAAEAHENAKSTARQQASDTVNEAAKQAKEEIAALGYIGYTDYETQINSALDTANAAILDADTQDAIEEAVTEFTAQVQAIQEEAIGVNEKASATAKQAAQETLNEKQAEVQKELDALKFIDTSEAKTAIEAAIEKAQSALEVAQDQKAIGAAVSALTNELNGIFASANLQNNAAKAALVEQAIEEIVNAKTQAETAIRALAFLSESECDAALASLNEVTYSFDEASDPDGLNTVKGNALTAVKQVSETAETRNAQARTEAIAAAKGMADEKAAETGHSIGAFGFISPADYSAKSALDAAYEAIETASDRTAIGDALAALDTALAALEEDARNANEAARNTAIETAEEKVSALHETVKERLNALKFLSADSYLAETEREAERTAAEIAAAQNQNVIDALLVSLESAFDGIADGAESLNATAKTAAVNAAKREIEAKLADAVNALDGLAFLSASEKTNYGEQATAASAADFTAAEDPDAVLKVKSDALERIGTTLASAEAANEENLEKARADALAQAKDLADAARSALEELDLSDEDRARFASEIDSVSRTAEGSVKDGVTPDALADALETLTQELDFIKTSAEEVASGQPTAAVQVVVEGIEAVAKTYDGADTVEFNTENVIYRNAKTGEIIEEEYTQRFVLTVSGRLSEYGVGAQIALITSITLTGAYAEAGEFVLAVTGQQAFAIVEVKKAALIVRVTEDGRIAYEGFVGGEDESVLTGSLRLETVKNDDGTLTVTPSGLESANYDIVFVSGILPAAQDTGVLWICLGILAGLAACAAVTAVCLKKRR